MADGAIPFDSPWGRGWVVYAGGRVAEVLLPGAAAPGMELGDPPRRVAGFASRVEAYLNGRGEWPDGTEWAASLPGFFGAVYRVVCEIPPGETVTYAEVARRAGRPGAARAVGAAMAANRLAPAIPCHRVVGSDGALRGYAGGIEMKRGLLEMEGRA